MQYVLVIHETPEAFAARVGDGREAYWGAWQAYADALRGAGVMAGGKGLEPPETGVVVRQRGGERTVQDGPFADAKEQLGGFFIVDVPDMEAALDWASRCPAVSSGGAVEVRPTLKSSQAADQEVAESQAVLAR